MVNVRFLETCWVSLNKLSRHSPLTPARCLVKYSGPEASFPNYWINSRSRWEKIQQLPDLLPTLPAGCIARWKSCIPMERGDMNRVEFQKDLPTVCPSNSIVTRSPWARRATTANDGPEARLEGDLRPLSAMVSDLFSVGRTWV